MGVFVCITVVVESFLLGSIPWGLIISKTIYQKDLREVGSGNIGTTNAIRALGKVGGYAVFVLDFAKGVCAGLIALALANWMGANETTMPTHHVLMALAFLASICGHAFSPWIGFKGGKGIAVGVGSMFVSFGPVVALAEIALFAVLVIATRYVSVGSIAAAIGCVPGALYAFWGDVPAIIIAILAGVLVVWAHRGNIERLMNGTENRVGKKKDA